MLIQLAKIERVVVLIDEYDKPMLDHITNSEMADRMRDILRQFYGILKSQDGNLRFVLLTGITKFSKVSVFSGLNNLKDLSMDHRYADMLGYTQSELEHYFNPHMQHIAEFEQTTYQAVVKKVKRCDSTARPLWPPLRLELPDVVRGVNPSP